MAQSFLRWLLLCPGNRCGTFVTEVSPTHVWQACSLCGKVRSRRHREDVIPSRPDWEPDPRFMPGTGIAERRQIDRIIREFLSGLRERGGIYDTEHVQFDEPCSRASAQEPPTNVVRHIALTRRLDPDYATNIERVFAGLSTPAPEEPYAYDPDDYPEGYAEGGGGDPTSERAD